MRQKRVGRNEQGRYQINDESLLLMHALIKHRGHTLHQTTPFSQIGMPGTVTIVETIDRAKPADLAFGDEWHYFYDGGDVNMTDVPFPSDEDENTVCRYNVMAETVFNKEDYAAYVTYDKNLQQQPPRIKTALTRRNNDSRELERYDIPSMLVDRGGSFLSWDEGYFEVDFDEAFFEFLWFLWQLFGFEYDVWTYDFFEDECEYENEEESRAEPLFVDAEVVQPILEYQKEEPLLLTYQPSEDEGTLAALYILNARSVPEAFCCFLMVVLSLDAVAPELRLLVASLLLSRIQEKEQLPMVVLLYTIFVMNCACLYGDEIARAGEWWAVHPWYQGLSASKNSSKARCPKNILPARLSLCYPHMTACLCYVLLLKALQMG